VRKNHPSDYLFIRAHYIALAINKRSKAPQTK